MPERSDLESRTRYEPAEVEPRIVGRWLDSGLFHPEPEGAAAENYSIAIPPPNVTGSLHMGHALNGAIQDVLIRHHRMRGQRTKWIFGTDHAGIATQTQVERRLLEEGTSREEIGREAFIRRAWEWREQYGSTIVNQFQRLGASADYEDERFTFDEAYVRAVMRVFVDLHEKGYIYRDRYIVNWDPGSRSAISDLEVAELEVDDVLYSIDYDLEGGGKVTVATVRPETMLADTAVAVNPEDERYRDLVGRTAILPLVGRRLPVIADEYVKTDFGTGQLKITPGHDPNDFEIGRRHGLDVVTVIGEDGRMTAEAGERFAGLPVLEAREAVVAALEAEGRIAGREPYRHAVPFSHRSGKRIEPLVSLQWFMRMDELARPGHRRGRVGPRAHPSRRPAPGVPRLDGEHPAVVHLAAALVGPSAARLVPRRRDLRGDHAAGGRGLGARPRRARHLVLVGAVALRHAGLARRHAAAARLLPDGRALDGPGHPVPVGGPDDHDGARVRRRRPVRGRLRPLGDPGPGRAPHEQVARDRHRPAGRDRGARRRRRALRPAGDVVHPGRALLGREDRAGRGAGEQALECVAADPARRRRRRKPRAAAARRPRTAGSSGA